MIEIDFEGVSAEGGYPVLDAGLYKASITSVKAGTSQAGKPKIEFEFTLKDTNGRKMWRNYSLQANALWGLKRDLVALGIEVPEGKLDLDPDALVGMTVELQVSQKPHWQDQSRMDNEIEKVTKADDVDW